MKNRTKVRVIETKGRCSFKVEDEGYIEAYLSHDDESFAIVVINNFIHDVPIKWLMVIPEKIEELFTDEIVIDNKDEFEKWLSENDWPDSLKNEHRVLFKNSGRIVIGKNSFGYESPPFTKMNKSK